MAFRVTSTQLERAVRKGIEEGTRRVAPSIGNLRTRTSAEIAEKADEEHTHAIEDTTGLQIALDGKAASSHTHAIADVTGLQTALDAKMRRFAGLIGDGSTTAIAVSHSLNTRDIVWQVYDAATFEDTAPDSAERTDANTLTLTFAVAPASDALRVVVMG